MDPSKRKATWEFNLTSQYLGASTASFNSGASAAVEDTIGWGIGVGYNFSEYLELNFDAYWGDASYRADYFDENNVPRTAGGKLSSSSANVALTYNILPKRFTPFITASLGKYFFDTDLPTGPPVDGCWWYPWWNEICTPYFPTYRGENLTYSLLAGVRFDLGRAMYLKSSLGQQYLEVSNGATRSLTLFRLNFGWMFR